MQLEHILGGRNIIHTHQQTHVQTIQLKECKCQWALWQSVQAPQPDAQPPRNTTIRHVCDLRCHNCIIKKTPEKGSKELKQVTEWSSWGKKNEGFALQAHTSFEHVSHLFVFISLSLFFSSTLEKPVFFLEHVFPLFFSSHIFLGTFWTIFLT